MLMLYAAKQHAQIVSCFFLSTPSLLRSGQNRFLSTMEAGAVCRGRGET